MSAEGNQDLDIFKHASLDEVLQIVTRAVFQAGLSWAQIAKHWGAYRNAFDDFHAERVALYGDADIERVLAEPGVLRSSRKVRATVTNARALCAIGEEFGDFHRYAESFSNYDDLANDMKRRFSFLGDMNVWYVLFRCGERVPLFEAWVTTIPGEHPRMREMVERARAMGISSEIA